MLVDKKYIHIGKHSEVESGALVGYKPIRKVKSLALSIGSGCRFLSGAVIYAGSRIGRGATIAHYSIIREENTIGDNFCFWNNSVVDYGCRIGDNVKIHCNVYIAQFSEIEDDVFVGPGTVMINDLHPKCSFSKKCLKGPHIKKGAVIGANVTINPFVVVGERAVIGAGSVVTKDVPDRAVVCGNPARVICAITDIKCDKGLTDFPYRRGK